MSAAVPGNRVLKPSVCEKGVNTTKVINSSNGTTISKKQNGTAVHGTLTNGHDHMEEQDDIWDNQFLPSPLHTDNKELAKKVEEAVSGLLLKGSTLRRLGKVFEEELERGLNDQPSSLQCDNTYVPELPNGTEEGIFLALDLGGTNFRILLVELNQGQLVSERVRHYHISEALRLGPGQDLFEYLADCVQDFVTTEGINDEMSLGFTFSFPMRQHSISSGELITWTKSFKCGGMNGVDLVALLQKCLTDRGLKVTVQVLLNDTTGTLVAGAMEYPDVAIGVIMGTGSNGCYMECAERVTHWETARGNASDVIVDIEWGAFGDNGCINFIKTNYDMEVDDHSLLATSFTFEKHIGGKYLGEVAGAVLRALHAANLMPSAPPLHALHTAHLSLFEQENIAGEWERTAQTLHEVCSLGEVLDDDEEEDDDVELAVGGSPRRSTSVSEFTREHALVAQYVARVVTNRAAQLLSVCIAALVRRLQRPHVSVAVDGSVYKRHPRIQALVTRYVALLAPELEFKVVSAEDGSGKGSALTAAIAARLAQRS